MSPAPSESPRVRLVVVVAAALASTAGCGAERTPTPDVATPKVAEGQRAVDLPASGVAFRAPANWDDVQAQDARVGGVQSGTATLAVWRYPRTEPLPADAGELRTAQRRLVAQVRRRSPDVRIDSQRRTRVARAPAIVLTTTQTVAGATRRYRSVHVFDEGAEIVLDGSAPPAQFDRVDRTVYRPLVASLSLTAPTA